QSSCIEPALCFAMAGGFSYQYNWLAPCHCKTRLSKKRGYPAGSGDAQASQKVFLVLFVHKENSHLKPELYK
ncbi:hypothetical protein, partial [Rikenella microfusus]|uniref:hypothetical protein n=1 Tax=Rikenella microfusus TaxID=28139 RepID=UPI001D896EAC